MLQNGEVKYFPSLDALEAVIQYSQMLASLQASLSNHGIQSYFEKKPTLLAEADHLAVAWSESPNAKNSSVVGLISSRGYPAQGESPAFMHISTLHVAEAQHRGLLLKRLIAALYLGIWQREGKLPTWIVIKTFNPSVYNALLRLQRMIGLGAMLYPKITRLSEECSDALIRNVAIHVSARLEPDCLFDPTNGVICGGGGDVGDSYWSTTPRSSHQEINRFFDERLTPKDRMLCILGLDDTYGKLATVKLLSRWSSSASSNSLSVG